MIDDEAARPAPGEPVGRVNLAEEFIEPVWFSGSGDTVSGLIVSASSREKVLYGLMAIVLMVLAMVVILQGVFEQKMPI
jgi:hypothetical protein